MISIRKINEVDCDLNWNYNTLIVVNRDEPKALMKILGCVESNITNLYPRRINVLHQKAVTIIEMDESKFEAGELLKLDVVFECYFVPKDRLLGG